MASLPTVLLILAALSAGSMVIAILIALRSQREAQSAIFPIVREEESVRAKRAKLSIFMWVAITALFLGGWLATLRLTDNDETAATEPSAEQQATQAVAIEATAEPALPETEASPPSVATEPPATEIKALSSAEESSATIEPTTTPIPPTPVPPESSATPLDTSTPEPTATLTNTPLPATDTPTPTPPPPTSSATPTPIPPSATPTIVPPTHTPTPDLAQALQVPTSAPRTPAPAGAKIGPIQFAEDITENVDPINPAKLFNNGIPAVYAIYSFNGIPQDVHARAVWYKNGTILEQDEGTWPWGEKGRGYRFLVPRGPGLYKLELYVNDTVLSSGLFEVR